MGNSEQKGDKEHVEESKSRREAIKAAKKLGINLLELEEVDVVHLDNVWNLFFGAPKDKVPITDALKFTRHFCKACAKPATEFDQLVNDLDTTKTGFLTYIQYKTLFAEIVRGCGLPMSKSLIRTTSKENLASSFSDVGLNVYDLHDLTTVNNYALHLGFGAFHTGVVVYGTEVSFAYPKGVYQVKPGTSRMGRHRMSLFLGRTALSALEVFTVIKLLKKKFLGSEYKIADNNCHHFCEALSMKLIQKTIPPHVTAISKFASHFSGLLREDMLLEGRWASLNAGEVQRQSENEDPRVRQIATLLGEQLKPSFHLFIYAYSQNEIEDCKKFLPKMLEHSIQIKSLCLELDIQVNADFETIMEKLYSIIQSPKSEENFQLLSKMLTDCFELLKKAAIQFQEKARLLYHVEAPKKEILEGEFVLKPHEVGNIKNIIRQISEESESKAERSKTSDSLVSLEDMMLSPLEKTPFQNPILEQENVNPKLEEKDVVHNDQTSPEVLVTSPFVSCPEFTFKNPFLDSPQRSRIKTSSSAPHIVSLTPERKNRLTSSNPFASPSNPFVVPVSPRSTEKNPPNQYYNPFQATVANSDDGKGVTITPVKSGENRSRRRSKSKSIEGKIRISPPRHQSVSPTTSPRRKAESSEHLSISASPKARRRETPDVESNSPRRSPESPRTRPKRRSRAHTDPNLAASILEKQRFSK